MNMVITSIKIDKRVRDAAKIRAAELNMTFMAYYEDLILKDLKENKPELFKDVVTGRVFNAEPRRHRSILMEKYDPEHTSYDKDGKIILDNKEKEF